MNALEAMNYLQHLKEEKHHRNQAVKKSVFQPSRYPISQSTQHTSQPSPEPSKFPPAQLIFSPTSRRHSHGLCFHEEGRMVVCTKE